MTTTQIIETRSCYIEKINNEEDPILRVEKKLGIEMNIDDLKEMKKVYKRLIQNRAAKFLIVCQIDCSSKKDFMEEVSQKSRSKFKKAEAIIIKNLANRIEANFYIQNFIIILSNVFIPQNEVICHKEIVRTDFMRI